MSFYEAYKPFRNFLRGFDLASSLVDIWAYSHHVDDDAALPAGYETGRNLLKSFHDRAHPWEIDILAREVVLNAGKGGGHSFRRWKDMASAINHVRRIDNESFTACEGEPDVALHLHRIAHRQFPVQISLGVNTVMRAIKIFEDAQIHKIVERELGMTPRQHIVLGAAIGGHFINNSTMSINQDFSALGVPDEARIAFFRRITTSIEHLREETEAHQSYDDGWSYAWNPLEATPLVSVGNPDLLYCPIPRYLIARTMAGMFYDLVKISDFDNPFGRSFQTYIGEVISATCRPPRFIMRGEEPYYDGKNLKHGVDWVLSDQTGHLFVETKTKRLRLHAKNLKDHQALDADLAAMAGGIVQHYQNIRDALAGKTKWVPDGLPVYPMVLTLDDWYMFTPRVEEILQTHLRRKLAERGIAEGVLEEMPVTVASAQEFEIAARQSG